MNEVIPDIDALVIKAGQSVTFSYDNRTFRGTLVHDGGNWRIKLLNTHPGEPEELTIFL